MRALDEGIDPATLRVKPSQFVRWLFKQVDRQCPIGDLARDAKDDLRFPRSGSESEVAGYLLRYGDRVDEALEAARAEFQRAAPSKSTFGAKPPITIDLNDPTALMMGRVEEMLVAGDDNHHNQVASRSRASRTSRRTSSVRST